MGLFDVFDILSDAFNDIVIESGKELVEICTESANDIFEAGVHDVSNLVNDTPNKPCKTSYDIRDDAKKIIAQSDKRYARACDAFDTAWNKMHSQMCRVVDSRVEVYQLLGRALPNRRLSLLPNRSKMMQSYPNSSSDARQDFDAGTALGIFGTAMRREAAEQYLEDAEDYRVEVNGCISQLNQTQRLVESMSHACIEELEMLSIIRELYRNQSDAVLIESANILRQIAMVCADEVSTHTNRTYQKLVQKLQQLWM